jgi:hypothetical protein
LAPSVVSTACAPVSSSNDNPSHWSASDTAGFMFMIIGLPILGFLLVVTCLGCWCRKRRRKAKARSRTIAQNQMPAGESQSAITLVPVEGR